MKLDGLKRWNDRPLWYSQTVRFDTFGPFTLTLLDRPLWYFWTIHFATLIHSKDRPLLVEWPSALTHDRPLWLRRPSTIVLDRPLWLKWPSTLRTVHFHPFGPSTLDLTPVEHIEKIFHFFWNSEFLNMRLNKGNKVRHFDVDLKVLGWHQIHNDVET